MAKRIFAAICSLIMMIIVAGCADQPTESSQSEPTASEVFPPSSKTIKVAWFTQWWMSADEDQYLFDGFSKKYPDYTIEKVDLPDLPSLLAAIQAGNQPDVWMGGDPNDTNFTQGCYQSLFASLDDYMTKDPDLNFNTIDESQMMLTEFAGKHYALPYLTTQLCLVYNTKLLAEAGLNDPPKTWDELYDYAKKLTKFDSNGNIIQLGIADTCPWPYQLYNLNATNGDLKANGIDGDMDSAWSLSVNQYSEKFSDILGGAKTPNTSEFSFEGGKVAMTAGGNLSYLNVYAENDVDFDITFLPVPEDYSPTPYSDNVLPTWLWTYLTIPRGASNPNGGWLFAKYMMTDGMYLSVSRDAQENPTGFFPQYIPHDATRQKVYDTLLVNLPQELVDLIKKRDEMTTQNVYKVAYSPIHSTLKAIAAKWDEREATGEVNLKEKLEGMQTEYQSQLAIWKSTMEGQGWQFPADQDPIPPEDY